MTDTTRSAQSPEDWLPILKNLDDVGKALTMLNFNGAFDSLIHLLSDTTAEVCLKAGLVTGGLSEVRAQMHQVFAMLDAMDD